MWVKLQDEDVKEALRHQAARRLNIPRAKFGTVVINRRRSGTFDAEVELLDEEQSEE